MTLSEHDFSRAGAVAAVGGVVVYGLSAFSHPGTAPHLTEAAFAHYATEPFWGLIHLGEFLGVLLMATATLALAWRLRQGALGWTIIASAAMIVFTSIYAVFIAVDGVALGINLGLLTGASVLGAVFEPGHPPRPIRLCRHRRCCRSSVHLRVGGRSAHHAFNRGRLPPPVLSETIVEP